MVCVIDISYYLSGACGEQHNEKSSSKNNGFATEEPEEVTFSKLEILCDKQWHTSELPDEEIQNKMREWIVSKWREIESFLLLVLGVAYCFGLDEKLFRKALDLYNGEFKDEYIRYLENSKGDSIDPYWSMKNKN